MHRIGSAAASVLLLAVLAFTACTQPLTGLPSAGNAVFPANSTSTTVLHGMGVAPERVFISLSDVPDGLAPYVYAKTNDTFTLRSNTTSSAPVSYSWVAYPDQNRGYASIANDGAPMPEHRTLNLPADSGLVATDAATSTSILIASTIPGDKTFSGNTSFGGYLALSEIAAPEPPPADTAYFYAFDAQGNTVLHVRFPDGSVFQLARDAMFVAKNTEDDDLLKGEAVYVSGAVGASGFPEVMRAQADSDLTLVSLGVVYEDTIGKNEFGRILTGGKLENTDTDGYPPGTRLYVSADTPGALTDEEPQHPNLSQRVGVVMTENMNNGVLFVALSSVKGDELGTNLSRWIVGPAVGGGVVDLMFRNGNNGSLQWQPNADYYLSLPNVSGTLVTTTSTDSLLNKTLDSPIINTPTGDVVTAVNALTGSVVLAAGANVYLGTVGNTITINATSTPGGAGYDTFENDGVGVTQRTTVNLTSTSGLIAVDDGVSKTNIGVDSTVVRLAGIQSLENKTLQAPVLVSPTGDVITSINGATGAFTIAAGENIYTSILGSTLTINATSTPGGGGYDTIENDGTPVTQRTTVNLTSTSGLAALDDGVGSKTNLFIANDAITNARLRDSAGFSVIGKTATGTGDPADIVAADETVLGRTGGGSLVFAQVATGQIANSAVTYGKIQNTAAGFVLIGKANTGGGAVAEIALGTNVVMGRLTGNIVAGQLQTAQIADSAVTYGKMQNTAAGFVVLGKTATGAGALAEIAAGTDTVLGRDGSGNLAFGAVVTGQLTNNAVTFAKVVNASGASVLVGRGSAAGGGNFQEITLGANLTMTGTVLAASGGAAPTTVKITADQTKNNTTLANITGLVFALTSGTYYRFTFQLIMQTATATTGPRVSVTIPAATVFSAYAVCPVGADGTGNEFRGEITASDDAVICTALPVANTDYIVIIEGTILPSANGNLQARFANETGTVVVTVRQASMGILTAF